MKTLVLAVLAAIVLVGMPLEARSKPTSSRSSRSSSRSHTARRAPTHRTPTRTYHTSRRSSRRSHGYRSYRYRGYHGGHYYGAVYAPITGIRLNMELIPKKERKAVERGAVWIDGYDSGIVDRYNSWHNQCVPVAPGNHSVSVELEDGRSFETEVLVQPGQLLRVYIRFQDAESEKE